MPKLTLTDSGNTFEVPAGTFLLDYAQANGLDIPFGCTMGSCGTCGVEVEAGMENLNEISDNEQDGIELLGGTNCRLACQLVINGDVSLKPV
ncbi:MAG: (2Fe-2S)-binding protein [Planctomycetes bacterium]|nr:(2Fe-2S)-binding protein [Planctomycetota bacterium]